MNKYEYLVEYASECGAEVIELDLETTRPCGKCINDLLIINKNMSLNDKFCILSEELGHYKTTVGDITDQSILNNRKQELKARAWGYNNSIGLVGLINSFKHGCRSNNEVADYLGVTEEYLNDAINYYSSKYGIMYKIDNYTILFSPNLQILEAA
ncbi:MAG: ImmA/IrrE family metallo-endopeptidase [Clostridium sp.]|uniref:ImmA/IrrE family metallo-endopeptidase n=1 Tax=Clostridium sp. TaxID=1506 RepID=UPI003F2D7F75